MTTLGRLDGGWPRVPIQVEALLHAGLCASLSNARINRCSNFHETCTVARVRHHQELVIEGAHHGDITLLKCVRCHDIAAVVVQDSVCAHLSMTLECLQALEPLRSPRSHIDLVSIPEELLRCIANGETFSALRSRILCELVDASDEFSFEEEERVIGTDADLVRLTDIPAAGARASVDCLVYAEICNLFVLVVRLDQAKVVLFDNCELVLAQERKIVQSRQVFYHVDLCPLATLRLVIVDVHLVFNFSAAA